MLIVGFIMIPQTAYALNTGTYNNASNHDAIQIDDETNSKNQSDDANTDVSNADNNDGKTESSDGSQGLSDDQIQSVTV